MSSSSIPAKRAPLPISALLVIAALASAACVLAVPVPHGPAGGIANAAHPSDPGVDPRTLPSLSHVVDRLGNGIGEVATAAVSTATTR